MQIEIGLQIMIGQRPNVIADITNAIRPMNINITRANYGSGDNGRSSFEFAFEAADRDSIDRVTRTLLTVPGVTEVNTISVRELVGAMDR